jgi:MFS family permease
MASMKASYSLPARRTDIVLLLSARVLRGFGDGFAIIILPAYLSAISFTTAEIGFAATASLLGTALLTFVVGIVARRYELRSLLMIGAGIIVLTGLAFPNVDSFVLIFTVAFAGSLNPNAGDMGPLVPLEHAALAREATSDNHTSVFARYSLVGAMATAAGSLAAGAPQLLIRYGLTELAALKAMFYFYALLGLIAALVYRRAHRQQKLAG